MRPCVPIPNSFCDQTLVPTLSAENMSKAMDYEAVRKDIAAALKKPDYDDGSLGPVFVRLAW